MQERLGRAQEEAAHRAEDLAAVRAAVRGAGEESAGELATDIARPSRSCISSSTYAGGRLPSRVSPPPGAARRAACQRVRV